MGWTPSSKSISEALWGAMGRRQSPDGEPVALVEDCQGVIEMDMDVDAAGGIAATARAGTELEEAPIDGEGVVLLDRASIFEAADRVEVGGGWPPRGGGLCGGAAEPGVVAGQKPGEHAGGVRECAGLGQAEFDHEAILEGAKEPFDPPLRLRGMGADPVDAQFVEGAADLGLPGGPAELVVEGERRVGIRAKDGMAISVQGGGEAIAAAEVPEQEEIAVDIFLEAENGGQHVAGGVINGGKEYEAGAAVLEPEMMTAIELDEQAGLRHAVPAAAVARGPAGAGTADAGFAQPALDRGPRKVNVFPLGQELGEMAIIAAAIAGAGQGEHPGPKGIGRPVGGPAAAIAMGQRRQALLADGGEESADMADGKAQQPRRARRSQESGLDPWEDLCPLLLGLGQGDHLPGHSPRVTESLSS